MLRGLDLSGGSGGPEAIVRVAGRDPIEGRVTAYVDASAPDADEQRTRLRNEFDRLEKAGVVADAAVTTWQDADATARYEEFVDAVGAAALEPHFESKAGGNALAVPRVCVAVRDEDGDLTGLYPRADGDGATVEDGLRALRTGDGVENVAADSALSVASLEGEDAASEEIEQSGPVAKAD